VRHEIFDFQMSEIFVNKTLKYGTRKLKSSKHFKGNYNAMILRVGKFNDLIARQE